ncbi:uncharacterized protein Tco025E_01249 [Trypanosoma conorhini]|uniref:Uncharacterized protein n=1 Tax=Trypanosoma conorhini TaxID=83891 RepID=A0A422Q8T8_9TRYP|nr:uncharacterized protein Tco025E_01249 [Trypanosoma conorhini]RNF26388.1 hypothetical protein Tco025E_01249 [Trypanosoma conorhini]
MGSFLSKTPGKPSNGPSRGVKPPDAAAPPPPAPPGEVTAAGAQAGKEVAPFEARIRRFYTHYKPEKLENVPRILREWDGTEEELMQMLVERYGPEPAAAENPPITPPKAAAAEAANMWVPRFARHLLAYRPGKLSRLGRMLQHAEGTEEAMLVSLIEQLGPEPEGPLPDLVPDTVLVVRGEVPTEAAESQVAEEGTAEENNVAPTHSFRRRLSSFLGVRAPEKLYTLEECLRQHAEDEEGLLATLREKHGADPTEEEAQAYFTQRLEALYACHEPSRVTSAAGEIAAQYGKEEEFLQAVANEIGADPMMVPPPAEAHAHLFEYADAKEAEAPLHEASSPEQQCTHAQQMEAEALQSLEVSRPENASNHTAGGPPDEATLPATNAPVVNAEPPTATAPAPLQTSSGTEGSFKHVTETFRRIMEGQQQQISALQADLDRIRSIMEGEFHVLSQKGPLFTPLTVREPAGHASVPSPYPAPQSPQRIQRLNGASCGINKTTSLGRQLYRHDSLDGLLPPPPRLRPPRDASQATRAPTVKAPSLFVFRCSSSPRQVRTLAEMRLEYEREREGIRSAEKRLQGCSVIL